MNILTHFNLFVMLRENLLIFALFMGILPLSGQVTVFLNGTNPSCNAYTDGSVSTSVNGGTAPYFYLWNNGFSNASLQGVGAGFYSLTVTDFDGNTAEASLQLNDPDILSLNIQVDDICSGDGNATASASGGTAPYFYIWDDNQGGANAYGLSFGQHCATVTDVNGCQATACEIVYAPLSVIVVATDLNCATDCDASISAVVSGGFGPYTFLWSNGATTQIVENQPAGNYTVTVTDANGCSAVGDGTIGSPILLSVDVTIDNPPCGVIGGTGTVTANPSGGIPPYNYFWSTGENTQTISNLPPGNYFVVVTDAHNCQAVNNFAVIPVDGIDIDVSASPTTDCGTQDGMASASASGGTPPYSYEWSNSSTGSNVNGLAPGTYTVTATDAAGCMAVANVTVGGFPDVILMPFETDASCGGSDGIASVVVISGTAPFTYQWSNGVTTSVNPNLTPGTYSVTVTDANNCFTTANLNIGGAQNLELDLNSNNVSCTGANDGLASVNILSGTAPFDIIWSNGGTTSTILGLSSGTYSVSVSDGAGCFETGSITVSEPNPISLSVNVSGAGCTGTGGASANALGGTPPYSYVWSNGQTGQNLTNVSSGDYSVTVTDSEGCTKSETVTITSASPPSCNAFIISNISGVGASDGTAGVNVTGGTPPFFYLWSNGQVTSTATNLGAGTHSVTVTDANGCTTSCSVSFQNPAKLGDFAWLDLNRDGCQDTGEPGIHDVIIQLSGTDNAGNLVVRYDTSDFTGLYLFDGLQPGTYKIYVDIPTGYVLTMRDACGDATDSDINPSDNFSQNVTLSEGECYLDLDIGIYLKCDNITDPGEIEGDETLCGPGFDAGPITEVSPPSGGYGSIEFIWMYTTQPGPFNPGTWQIIPGATGPEYDPGVLYETTYYARCARRECCNDYLETDIVTKTVDAVATAVIEGPDLVCVDETVTYSAADAGPTATYFWNFGPWATPSTSTQQIVDVVFNSTGVVTIELQVSANGCQASNNLAVSITDNPSWCGNGIVISGETNPSGHVELEWEINNVPGNWEFDILKSKNGIDFEIIGNLSPTKESGMEIFNFTDEKPYTGKGFYKVEMRDETLEFFAESNILITDIFEMKNPFLIYPNPFENELKIDISERIDSDIEVQIYSPLGVIIQTETISKEATQHNLNMSDFSGGVYYVRLIYGDDRDEIFKVFKN